MKFELLIFINTTTAKILTFKAAYKCKKFMSRINFVRSRVEHETSFITSGPVDKAHCIEFIYSVDV